MITEAIRNQLHLFATTVWGNSQAVLKHDPSGFDYIDVEQYEHGLQALFGVDTICKILVRDEYRTALQELQTDTYARGAYVTGQPGIGKTLFLVYLLVELLGQCRRVVVHDADGQCYGIFADNTVDFHLLTDQDPLDSGDFDSDHHVWALSDSSAVTRFPPVGFWSFEDRHIRTIQATSPRKDRWHDWSKLATAKCYVMDIWTEEEIRNLATLLNFNTQRLVYLYKKWGGAPRTLLEYVSMADQAIDGRYRGSARLAVAKCRTMIESVPATTLPDDAPSTFFFCRPLNYGRPNIDRRLLCAVVPTTDICYFLAEGLRIAKEYEQVDLIDVLGGPSETRAAAGYIYEALVRSLLAAGQPIPCNWLRSQDRLSILSGTTNSISARSNELRNVTQLPYFWVAPRHFPGIDAALIREDGIYVLQITISDNHKTPKHGMKRLRDDLPGHLKNLPWHVVFVGHVTPSIRSVAERWKDKISFPTNDKVPIAWACVDPLDTGITYRLFRESESHSMMEVDFDDVH